MIRVCIQHMHVHAKLRLFFSSSHPGKGCKRRGLRFPPSSPLTLLPSLLFSPSSSLPLSDRQVSLGWRNPLLKKTTRLSHCLHSLPPSSSSSPCPLPISSTHSLLSLPTHACRTDAQTQIWFFFLSPTPSAFCSVSIVFCVMCFTAGQFNTI